MQKLKRNYQLVEGRVYNFLFLNILFKENLTNSYIILVTFPYLDRPLEISLL